jgi:hypothetical protein
VFIWCSFVFCLLSMGSERRVDSVKIPLSLLGNGSVDTLPR